MYFGDVPISPTFKYRFSVQIESPHRILNNLLYIYIRFIDSYEIQFDSLWLSLAHSEKNVIAIVDFLVEQLILRNQHNTFEIYGKKVIFQLTTKSGFLSTVIETLINHLQHFSPLFSMEDPLSCPLDLVEHSDIKEEFLAPLQTLISASHDIFLTIFNYPLLFLVEIVATCQNYDWSRHLPILLHSIILGFDHIDVHIFLQCKQILLNLLYTLKFLPSTGTHIEVRDLLLEIEKKPWSYADSAPEISSMSQLKNMVQLICKVFTSNSTDKPVFLLQGWGEVATHFATLCHVRHYACRSFEIIRSLDQPFSDSMLVDIMVRLADSVSNSNQVC